MSKNNKDKCPKCRKTRKSNIVRPVNIKGFKDGTCKQTYRLFECKECSLKWKKYDDDGGIIIFITDQPKIETPEELEIEFPIPNRKD